MNKNYEIIHSIVSDYFERNGRFSGLDYMSLDDRSHVIDTGTDILMCKWDINPYAGGFSKAVVNNDLREAFGRADDVNTRAMKFHVMLMHNVGKPTNLIK